VILINLLPHREAARKRRRETYQAAMLGAAMAGLLIAGAIYWWFQMMIENQQAMPKQGGSSIFSLGRSTGVIEFLRHNAVERVLVGGLALDYCVKTTALQLRRAGFAVDVFLPACRAIADDTASAACAEMRAAGILLHASLDELDAALQLNGDN